jgi:hypothetical protein
MATFCQNRLLSLYDTESTGSPYAYSSTLAVLVVPASDTPVCQPSVLVEISCDSEVAI